MSAGSVFQAALRLIMRQELSDEANRDVLPVLEAVRSKGLLALLEAAAHDGGLDAGAALARAGALYVGCSAGNLCDDLIDGECTYLDEPLRKGPSLQYLLQFIMVRGLLAAGLPGDVIAEGCAGLARSASWSHLEVRTRVWTATVYRQVGEGVAGQQWASLLPLLWWNTPLADRAARVGRMAAIAGHVAEDVRSGDPRFTSMPDTDRADVLGWAREAVSALRAEDIRSMTAIAAGLEQTLKSAH
jgi:hypothetical protein